MLNLSKWLSTRSLRLLVLPLALIGLVSCSNPVLTGLLGGGPKVAANTQVGKTNTQTVGTNTVNNQKLVRPQARTINQSADSSKVKADKVETVVVHEYPIWLILAFVVAVLLDSPLRIFQDIFYRKK